MPPPLRSSGSRRSRHDRDLSRSGDNGSQIEGELRDVSRELLLALITAPLALRTLIMTLITAYLRLYAILLAF